MSIKALYNSVANQYDKADCFGSITTSHNCAIDQINRANLQSQTPFTVLDLGVGDGSFLQKIRQQIPSAEFTGIDISKEMLKKAAATLPLHTIEASAAEATHYLPMHSQNLVLAYFINAYIPMNILFKQAEMLTKEDGYFSVITTTYDSFPIAQQQLANFITQESMVSCIVGHYYKSALKNTTVASGKIELLQEFGKHHFSIVEHQRLELPITLNNIDELAQFGIEGTWFLNSLSISNLLPKRFLLQRIKKLINKIFTFPYHDTHVIDVILAKKVSL